MAGYQSILDRVGLLITANLNALIDRALGANSVAVFDEYLNRMHGALDALTTAEGVERGRSRTVTRQLSELDVEIRKLDGDVDRLLERGERTLAAARQAVLNTKTNLRADLQEDLERSRAEVEKLADARAKLQAQIEVTRAKRQELVSLMEQRKAAELRYRAQAGAHAATPGTLRTDEILERARQEVEVAEGKNEALASTLDARIDEILGAEEIEAQLQEREARLRGR